MKCTPFLVNLFAYFFIGMYEDRDLIAGYGVCSAVYCFFFSVIISNVADISGIYHAKAYGAKNYKNMYLAYYRGFGLSAIIMTIGLIFYIRLDLILIGIGFAKEIAWFAYIGSLALIPYVIVSTFNENYRSWMITLGYERVFDLTNIMQFIIGIPLAWL